MKRMTFLSTLMGTGAAACAGAAAIASGPAPGFRGKRFISEHSHVVGAAPGVVFPLLCPVREYEWLDGWACDLIYSDSGVAEDNCIFRTSSHGVPMIWSVSRSEPPKRIEFVAVAPERHVMRLNIDLEPVESGTKLHWMRIFTALSETGSEELSHRSPAADKTVAERLEYFVKTGKMLVQGGH
jgi:hypothetical protein